VFVKTQESAEPRGEFIRLAVATMRPEQWTKNLFVFGPLLFARKLADPHAGLRSLVACVSFCLLASAIYVLNDLVDAEADRNHPVKQKRPIASGKFPTFGAWVLFVVLTVPGLYSGASLSNSVAWLVMLYFAIMVAYCVGLKRILIVDSMVIAAGFVLRVVTGAAAVRVEATHWLIACAFLLALYLAFAKRRQELTVLSGGAASHRHVLGRYSKNYLDQVNNILLGTVVVCYALYTVAPETVARFGTDLLIYGSVFVLYGTLRYMALLQMEKGDDPSLLVLRDKPLLFAVFCWCVYNCLVIYRRDIFEVGRYLMSSHTQY